MGRGAFYRLQQFRRALDAAPDAAALYAARQQLSPAQWLLFQTLSPRDQWHSVETMRTVQRAGHFDNDLLTAALLHDAGKGYIALHHRILYVLLARMPLLLRHLAAPCGSPWRTALHRSANHTETGACLALAAGASERAVALIRGHHRLGWADPEARALAIADDTA